MPRFEETRVLPHSHDFLYELISDVASYQNFIPGVLSSVVLNKTQQHILADLTVGKGLIQATYRSSVKFTPHHIEIKAIEGPFTHLHSTWDFEEIDIEETKICFCLDFELNTSSLQTLIHPILKQFAGNIIAAFEKRALFLKRLQRRLR